jgi:hypothetical protein
MSLKLVTPGEGDPHKYDDLLNLIFQVLPCDMITQVVEKVNKLTTTKYHVSQVNHAICHLRKHADEYRWTIPHAKRGHGLIKGKYFGVVRREDGGWEPPPSGSLELLYDGNRGTLSEIATKAENNAVAIEIYATQVPSPATRRLLRRLARDQRHVSEQAKDLADEASGT